jgi:hypothetical protein
MRMIFHCDLNNFMRLSSACITQNCEENPAEAVRAVLRAAVRATAGWEADKV